MKRARGFRRITDVFAFAVLCCIQLATLRAQTESATISGIVTDSSGAVVVSAQILLNNIERGTSLTATTNGNGLYVFPAVEPGQYRLSARKDGFKKVDALGIIVNVQDRLEENFHLDPGSVTESVTVNADALRINTSDATVSTVIDRNFADNLPMNGRSFQTLIDLTPGVVAVSGGSSGVDSGQFSVNGQRSASNYWTVDGVSANTGSSTGFGGQIAAGAVGATSVLGGTNSLVSIDALQEFRIQTSTFAPEYGRTPGAQISIVTRSGSNEWHGSAFDYVRNDLFDAANWFNGYKNNPPLPKAEERQNDFGGTVSGPIKKSRTFFFFSYEGLRLRLPTTALSTVPDSTARLNASSPIRPYLNAYPLDPHQPDLGNGIAQFNASFSNPATLNAYALRVDHKLTDRLTLFGRYNYSPSSTRQRGVTGFSLNSVELSSVTLQTLTLGLDLIASSHFANEFRFNYSRASASSSFVQDGFGGAVPLSSLGFPSPFTASNSQLSLAAFSLMNGSLDVGASVRNVQRQFNVINNTTVQEGTHSLKLGIDYRRLSPIFSPASYTQLGLFPDVASFENGNLLESFLLSQAGGTFLFHNLSLFAQDTWRLIPRLTLTYGLRWDTDFAPGTIDGPPIPAASGFNLRDLSALALASPGTDAFKTTYANFAPRIGIAYQIVNQPRWTAVARGGFGIFYDLATSETANLILRGGYPFSNGFTPNFGGTFPLTGAAATPPLITPPSPQTPGALAAFDPHLQLPYVFQWNVALEQQLGSDNQSVSATYIGSAGRRLLQSLEVNNPSTAINAATLVTNAAESDYEALQLQFQRRLSRGFGLLASYSISHSIDTASAGNVSNGSNAGNGLQGNANRASSDFDIRNAASAGLTYTLPDLRSGRLLRGIIHGWSTQSVIQGHSAPPLTVIDGNFTQLTNGFTPDIRPDLVSGLPMFLYGSQFPGGRAINNTPGLVKCADGSESVGPFCPPPSSNGIALRQGTLPRNSLRGFGLFQWDFAVHRDFPLHEQVRLQFRAEMFNVLNHPNFGPPDPDISHPNFGISNQMLGQYLGAGGVGSGAFDPLYQIGGPRSVQLALKLSF